MLSEAPILSKAPQLQFSAGNLGSWVVKAVAARRARTISVAEPSEGDIRRQLELIVASSSFETSQRNRKFLRYVVEETLAGRADRIKAYSIATIVFERHADFDPQTDPIIRIEASRLRRALDHYYLAAGQQDPIRIVVPKGSYVPIFEYADSPAARTASGQAPAWRQAVAARLDRRSALIGIGCTLVLVGGVVGAAISTAFDRTASAQSQLGSPAAGVSIAVLPFELADGDPSIGARLARDVAFDLTRFADLSVFQRQSRAASGSTDYLLSAHGEMAGDGQLRISVELADGRTDRQLWSARFESGADAADRALRLEDLARRVSSAIGGPRGAIAGQQARETATVAAKSATPYQCVLRYRLSSQTADAASLALARECLERAVKVDPGYASAHAALAHARLDSIRARDLNTPDGRRRIESAVASARRAIELAPLNGAGYAALLEAKWLQGEVEQSLAAGERALSLSPNDPEIMAAVGFRQGLRGDWSKAVPLLEQAFTQDPDLPSRYRQVTSLHLYMTGRYDAALAEAKRIDLPDSVYTHVLQAIAAAKAGRPNQARTSIHRILSIDPRFAETMTADLEARNVHPALIRAIAEGLQSAGLEVVVRHRSEGEDDAA